MDYIPGIYEVISDVKIRREPRIVDYSLGGKPVTNQVGLLKAGTKRAVYDTYTDNKNMTWGRLSLHDSAGSAEWSCIKESNREFMKFIEPLNNPPPIPTQETQLDRIERKIDKLLEK